MAGPATKLKPIPEPTLRRLPVYLRRLHLLRADGCEVVSSTQLGADLHLDPMQVRKDLEHTGLVGRPRIGHSIPALIEAIETLLGWDTPTRAVLIGAGNLGAALLGDPWFARSRLEIIAAFDTSPDRIGTELHGHTVLPLSGLRAFARRRRVKVGIITVPDASAQPVADTLVAAGVPAIWNFAPTRLHLPEDIIVRNEDLYSGLASLSQKLAARLRSGPTKEGHHAPHRAGLATRRPRRQGS